jgi:hypothetical protein
MSVASPEAKWRDIRDHVAIRGKQMRYAHVEFCDPSETLGAIGILYYTAPLLSNTGSDFPGCYLRKSGTRDQIMLISALGRAHWGNFE